jgi:endonuclease YncB( thermonuclease family)
MCLLQSAFLIGETAQGGLSMGKLVSPTFGRRLYWPSIVVAFAIGIALVLAAEPFLPQPDSLPKVTRLQTTTPQIIPQKFEPQIPQKFEVVDGDTVDFQSTRYRLVGFNTPESGTTAQCAAERAMAAKASQRLNQLLASGEPFLKRVPCACAPGTEGSDRCNYGRLCGVLTVGGEDLGRILRAARRDEIGADWGANEITARRAFYTLIRRFGCSRRQRQLARRSPGSEIY